MTDKINGRTPEEIKRGLEYYAETDLAKKLNACKQGLKYWYAEDAAADALAYIQQLEERVVDLNKTSKQLERERDAAVEQLQTVSRPCNSCKYGDEIVENDTVCKECKIVMRNGELYYDHWQWRGPEVE